MPNIISIIVSPNKLKKYRAIYDDDTYIDFGARGYTQYKDKLGYYKDFDNLDPVKRANYYKRHAINYPKYSADYLSKFYLW
jgi:hypothetical protein